jgi:hypothetical protein
MLEDEIKKQVNLKKIIKKQHESNRVNQPNL